MRLSRYTDYALRVLIYLGTNSSAPVSVSKMAAAYGVSLNHLVKVVHGLVKARFLASTRGRSGGSS